MRAPGYKKLESLLSADPAEVVQELSSFGKGFESLLNEREIRRDLMALLIEVLAKVCDCTTSPHSVIRVLTIVVDVDFLSRNLSKYIYGMMTEQDHRYLSKASDQIKSILKLMKSLVQRVKASIKDVQVVLTVIEASTKTLGRRGISLSEETHELLEELQTLSLHIQEEQSLRNTRQRRGQEGPPPNDFRRIPIFPSIDEINTDIEPYLRHNVVHGRYEDLNHYLDVQFRLLRQDFLEPLRLGIAQYLQLQADGGKKSKVKDIRIYHDVSVHFPICTNEGITHRVSFDVTKFGKIRWQATKRLTFGSLVCLSNDDFKTVIVFATVANRKPEHLQTGLVDLRFQDMGQLANIQSSDKYIMAESSAYFEAYRHVLEGLQEVRDNSLPLQRYIIDVSSDVQPPQYLHRNRNAIYDLSPLTVESADEEVVLGLRSLNLRRTNPRAKAVEVLREGSWPRAEILQFDESQLEAVRAALTQEIAVIQGPPGTGKTYIGLKIVRALLHNISVWNAEDDESPILVVCYTNHALDQFLEGILEFNQNIVRVGGRSNSEDMKNKNLNFLKREERRRKKVQRAIHHRTGDVLREMYTLRQHMEVSQHKVEKSMNGIISEVYLEQFMTNDHYATLTVDLGYSLQTSRILEWLGVGGGNFRVAGNEQNLAAAAAMWQTEPEPDDVGDDEIDLDEEADILAGQRILDDDDDDPFHLDEDAPQENHVVLDLNDLDREEANVDPQQWQFQSKQKKRMKKMLLHNLRKPDRMTKEQAERIRNVWTIRLIEDRWQLYRYWVYEYCSKERRRMEMIQGKYENLSQELKEVRVEEDLSILRRANVIGMTTTGAAKYRNVLHRVGPKIVVVEEAAEVLESHIITTLSAECQHLILIGDHQQLRPNPTVYRLAKEFNLDISLFERMINNGVPCKTLVEQHRMRPKISSIMKHHFYPKLLDHHTVKAYPKVAGVSSDVFFLNHDIAEQHVDDSMSKSNLHEAEVLAAFCKYLIQQGQYQPSQITILTTYVGQIFNFRKLLKRSVFSGVRVCVVDNFQGEENDIILLSLVRSNQEGQIGFLKVSNRMCVALSRARHGFYCIGNFEVLAHGSELWRDIVHEVKSKGIFGKSLDLVCHNHPEKVSRVSRKEDFLNVAEGGCNKPCEYRLNCGHSCTLLCHPTDLDHKEFKCTKPCNKVLTCGHKCNQLCFIPCGKCNKQVAKMLPCGHQKRIPCYQNPDTATCEERCNERLACNHRCQKLCGQECTVTCVETTVRNDWPCKHMVTVKCSDGPEKCPEPCTTDLECSHRCKGTCGSCSRGRLHEQCSQICDRTLVCGHACAALCTRNCPPCSKKCQNRCVHSKCPSRCGDPCKPCQEPCAWRCRHHECRMKCSEVCDRLPCNIPCNKRLKCGHPCIGLCGEPCPKKCRECNRAEVTTILFGNEDEPDARFVELEDCQHIVEVNSLDQWMSLKSEKGQSVQLKVCPVCKTPIRRNLRYGSYVNAALKDIETVKARLFGNKLDIVAKRRQVRGILLQRNSLPSGVADAFEAQMDSPLSLGEITSIENKLNLLVAIKKAEDQDIDDKFIVEKLKVKRDLKRLQQWLMKPRLYISDQELIDCSNEQHRLSMCLSLFQIKSKLPTLELKSVRLKTAEDLLLSRRPLSENDRTTVKAILKAMKQKCTGLVISEDERKMIVKAMGLTQGHWYKCPNGHVYAIGDCGGANQGGKCPDCKANIGGQSHRLADGNAVASEMDGARYAAWSEQANMENYDRLQLMNL